MWSEGRKAIGIFVWGASLLVPATKENILPEDCNYYLFLITQKPEWRLTNRRFYLCLYNKEKYNELRGRFINVYLKNCGLILFLLNITSPDSWSIFPTSSYESLGGLVWVISKVCPFLFIWPSSYSYHRQGC